MAKKKKGGVSMGLVAATVAVALGGYLLYGVKEANKNRKKVKGWMLKAKGEVLERVEKVKKLDAEDYARIVNSVETKYKKMKTVSNKELAELSKELKAHWKEIEREAQIKKPARKKKPVRKAKKVAKKPTRKPAKKTIKRKVK